MVLLKEIIIKLIMKNHKIITLKDNNTITKKNKTKKQTNFQQNQDRLKDFKKHHESRGGMVVKEGNNSILGFKKKKTIFKGEIQ